MKKTNYFLFLTGMFLSAVVNATPTVYNDDFANDTCMKNALSLQNLMENETTPKAKFKVVDISLRPATEQQSLEYIDFCIVKALYSVNPGSASPASRNVRFVGGRKRSPSGEMVWSIKDDLDISN